MFCPRCGSEYKDSVRRCPDCDTELVREPVDEHRPDASLVPLLSTHNVGDLAIISGILDDSQIRYHIQGENGLHLRPHAEPAIMLVASDDFDDAKELLQDIDPSFMAVSFHEHDRRKER